MNDINSARKSKFESAVYSEAEKQKQMIIDTANFQRSETLEKIENDFLNESYNTIQKEIKNITDKLKSNLAKNKIECRRQMLLKREELKNLLFDNVKKRLLTFIKTEEYKQVFIEKVKKIISENNLSSVVLKINSSDESLLKNISNVIDDNSEIINDKNILFGGFIIIDSKNSVIYDESYDSKILDEEERFCTYSGMNI